MSAEGSAMGVIVEPSASEAFTPASLPTPTRTSKSVGRNIQTPRLASGPQRTSLVSVCSSFTRTLR
jgi:hypothetical protein